MIRQPDLKTVAALLRSEFSRDSASQGGHQWSLNLAAQTRGYKNWAHYATETASCDTSATAPVPPTPATASAGAPRDEFEAQLEELRVALQWISTNYVATLSGRPVRDADECLSYAKKLLEAPRKARDGDLVTAPVYEQNLPTLPLKVDWLRVAMWSDLTHIVRNGNLRDLCWFDREALFELNRQVNANQAPSEALLSRVLFAYTVAEADGHRVELTLRQFIDAIEVAPGEIGFSRGEMLTLLCETESGYDVFSPAANGCVAKF